MKHIKFWFGCAYLQRLILPIINRWESLTLDTMGPLHFPRHPLDLTSFWLKALKPATWTALSFKTKKHYGQEWRHMASNCYITRCPVYTDRILYMSYWINAKKIIR